MRLARRSDRFGGPWWWACLALVLPAALSDAGCAPGLVHPMRVRNGANAEVGVSFAAMAGRSASCDETGNCSSPGFVFPGPSPFGSLGYGAVVDGHVGLLIGIAWPGRLDTIADDWDAELSPRVFGMLTLQDRFGSLGLATDVTIGGASGTVLLEVRPGGSDVWIPSVGVFNRWYTPWEERRPYTLVGADGERGWEIPTPPAGYRMDGVAPGVELGTRVTIGVIFVQLSGQMEFGGTLRSFQIPIEGQSYSQARILVAIGVSPDGIHRLRHGEPILH